MTSRIIVTMMVSRTTTDHVYLVAWLLLVVSIIVSIQRAYEQCV